MNIFDKLMDINEASERYNLTPNGIKQHIGKKIKEGVDCKKFGNSWVFVKSSLDIVFRDRLKDGYKPLNREETEMLYKTGEDFMLNYKDKFGKDQARSLCFEMNDYLHNNNKNQFIHTFLEQSLVSDSMNNRGLTYCISDEYYPESCFALLIGMNNGLNK